jgi:hypothetical protein
MNGKKIQYLNEAETRKAFEEYMTCRNGEDWRIIIQKVGVDYRVQMMQVQHK